MRRSHVLKHNIRSENPSQCIFFDTETTDQQLTSDTKQLVLKFGVACFIRKRPNGKWTTGVWYEFTTPDEFWQWVDSQVKPKHKTYLFAHNLVFDMTVTNGFTILPKLQWKLIKAIIDDPPTILNYRKGKASICLLDTFNWFHSSLAALGDAIGYPKLPMPSETDSSESWRIYCRQDVTILREAMMAYMTFVNTNDLGNFQMTQASQAFSAYRHRFMHHRILIDSNDRALSLARSAYYGGRTEAFYLGEKTGDFYLLDVNSMYPFVMSIHNFPSFLRSVYSRVRSDELAEILEDSLAIADVTVDVSDPYLPLRADKDLLFPTGQFRTVLATAELERAYHNHDILKVHRVAIFEGQPLFAEYVDTMYRLRQEYKRVGNLPFEYLCKLMLNSLYGKFGQTGRIYQDERQTESPEVKSWEEWDVPTHSFIKYRQFGGLIQTYKNEGESFNSHPAIAAHVTSYARIWLWKLIETAGRDNVYYCDTDSLVVNKAGYDILSQLYLGSSLGELKLERQFSTLTIHSPKDYVFGGITKIKGIRKQAVEESPGTFRQERFGKFKSMVQSGDLDRMLVTSHVKTLKREYNKGEKMDDGRVKPLSYYIDDQGESMLRVTDIAPEHRGQFDPRYDPKPRLIPAATDDRSMVDRLAAQGEKQEARCAGKMIYQRGSTRRRSA